MGRLWETLSLQSNLYHQKSSLSLIKSRDLTLNGANIFDLCTEGTVLLLRLASSF